MSLVGNLEDLGLGEILQIVSLSRKSGLLSLHSRGREGRIFFRSGQVTQATSSAYRQSLGELLVRRGLLELGRLKLALTLQEQEGYQERLGSLLIRFFGVSSDAIEGVVREQIEKVVYSLFVWSDGTFDFDLQELCDLPDDILMNPLQFMLQEGLNPQYLAMEGSRLVDERRHRGEPMEEDSLPDGSGAAGEEAVAAEFFLRGLRRGEGRRTPERSGRMPVVVVDDDPSTREALGFLITKGGFDPVLCERGDEALFRIGALCRSGGSPLVMVDLLLPPHEGSRSPGGGELLKLVQSGFPLLPLVALGEFHDPESDRTLRELGIPFLIKPRRSEIADPVRLKRFNEQLLPLLLNPLGGSFDLGEAIRLELGESEVAAPELSRERKALALLRGMLSELNNPAEGGGIILLVLRYAAEFMSRAIIFMVKKDEISGLGQFGVRDTDRSADALVRSLRIPRSGESLFQRVIDRPFPVRLRPDEEPGIAPLCQRLGGGVPPELFLGPIISEGRVVAILYGDNLTAGGAIGETDGLEIFLDQAGLAMEKALLRRRLTEQGEVHP